MSDYLPLPSSMDILNQRIEAGNGTLMRQAQSTANTYMRQAIEDIDETLGKGYAAKHPELIAAYMQTAAIDLGTAIIARAIESVDTAIEGVGTAIKELAEPIVEAISNKSGDEEE